MAWIGFDLDGFKTLFVFSIRVTLTWNGSLPEQN